MLNNLTSQGDSLAMRTVSGFPLSIGTGLAFEAVFRPTMPVYDPTRLPPTIVDITKYDECWINLATLFRNMIGSISQQAFLTEMDDSFVDTLLSEIEVIEDLFRNEGSNIVQPMFYFMDYDKLKAGLPKELRWREDKTANQQAITYKRNKVLNLLRKKTDLIPEFDSEIRPTKRSRSLILTHQPYDLLSYRNFDHLTLLESHTGKTKERNQWYTKYYPVGNRDMSHLPFLRKLFLIFGDKNLVSPSDIKLRNQILDIAEKRHWTGLTTEARVMQELELDIKEPFVVQFLKKL